MGGDKVVPVKGMMAREIYKELESCDLKQPWSLGSCGWETPVPGHPSSGKQDRALHKIKVRSLFCAGAVAEDRPRLCMWQGRLSLWDHFQGYPGTECLHVVTRMHTGADSLYAVTPVCPGAGASVQLLLVCRCRLPLCGVMPWHRCSPLPECGRWLCLYAILFFLLWLFGLASSKENRTFSGIKWLSGFLCWYVSVVYPITKGGGLWVM